MKNYSKDQSSKALFELIEAKRKQMYKTMKHESHCCEEILASSRELDDLIVQYQKARKHNSDDDIGISAVKAKKSDK